MQAAAHDICDANPLVFIQSVTLNAAGRDDANHDDPSDGDSGKDDGNGDGKDHHDDDGGDAQGALVVFGPAAICLSQQALESRGTLTIVFAARDASGNVSEATLTIPLTRHGEDEHDLRCDAVRSRVVPITDPACTSATPVPIAPAPIAPPPRDRDHGGCASSAPDLCASLLLLAWFVRRRVQRS